MSEVYIGKRKVKGVPCDSTSGNAVWIKAGYYWQEGTRHTKLITKSRSVLSDFYYENNKSLIPWKQNSAKQKLAKMQKLIKAYGTICP
jgi:hypothetical protein